MLLFKRCWFTDLSLNLTDDTEECSSHLVSIQIRKHTAVARLSYLDHQAFQAPTGRLHDGFDSAVLIQKRSLMFSSKREVSSFVEADQ